MTCRACTEHLEHCHGVSVVHADGTTECTGDGPEPCRLAHHLHDWQLPCTVLDPPCPCHPEEAPIGADAYELAAAA
ncbi:MAG TPA: hypothetical protein VGB14_08325 [Acidimicrobiales bacterium]